MAARQQSRISNVSCAGEIGQGLIPSRRFELANIQAIETAATALKKHHISITYQVDEPWKRSFFLTDPDGMMMEYYAFHQGAPLIQTSEDVAYLV